MKNKKQRSSLNISQQRVKNSFQISNKNKSIAVHMLSIQSVIFSSKIILTIERKPSFNDYLQHTKMSGGRELKEFQVCQVDSTMRFCFTEKKIFLTS